MPTQMTPGAAQSSPTLAQTLSSAPVQVSFVADADVLMGAGTDFGAEDGTDPSDVVEASYRCEQPPSQMQPSLLGCAVRQHLFAEQPSSHRHQWGGDFVSRYEVPIALTLMSCLHVAIGLSLPCKLFSTLAHEGGLLHGVAPNQVILSRLLISSGAAHTALNNLSATAPELRLDILRPEVGCHPVTRRQVLGSWPIVTWF